MMIAEPSRTKPQIVLSLSLCHFLLLLRSDGNHVGQAKRRADPLAIAHVRVVVFVDIGVGNLLEIASTHSIDKVHGAGGARRPVVLIASRDEDLASVGGGGSGQRKAVAGTLRAACRRRSRERDRSRALVIYVVDEHCRNVLPDDDHLLAVVHQLRVDRSEIALAEADRRGRGEAGRWQQQRNITGELQRLSRRGRLDRILGKLRSQHLKRSALAAPRRWYFQSQNVLG